MEKMLFELTNDQRKYLGLIPVEKNWDLVQLSDMYLYFDGDIIRKKISVKETYYFEQELNEKTAENRTILLPKTAKGKPKKLNYTGTQSFGLMGGYFKFSSDYLTIANYTTQTSFYYERFKENGNLETFQKWLKNWISDTTEKDLAEIEAFKTAERKHYKYKEGDFFAFKTDRRNYAFGRILIDVDKLRKAGNLKENKNYGLTNLSGKALIVKVYHKISDTLDVDLKELSQTLALPSCAVMDNEFYYGENIIIGNLPLKTEDNDMLISYSKSIKSAEKDTIYLQYGFIYKEGTIQNFDKHLIIEDKRLYSGFNENPFRNEGIGFSIQTVKLKECIAARSNKPFWETLDNYSIKYDLRNPVNSGIKREIFNYFGLDADKSYEQNLLLSV